MLTYVEGSIVRPHTDITELYNNLKPLWFDGVDPSKINIGIAYYGRTYKLKDSSCGTMNQCQFKGPGAAGECTAFEGVLSNREIRAMIEKEGYKPYFNKTAMVKYMTYGGDNWVGFDDDETIAMKEDFANSLCLGGTMVWSVDFDASVGGGGGGSRPGTDLVWVDPAIWNTDKPTVTCNFPCTVVLPPWTKTTTMMPYPLVTITESGFTTTVTRPPMTVSVIWISTLVIGGGNTPTSSNLPATLSTDVTLYTTPVWPSFTLVITPGVTITTSAPGPPPPPLSEITRVIPSITFVSGLPPRPTTSPYSTPCPFTSIAALCPPFIQDNQDDGDNGKDEGCKGEDCDSGGGSGGCKLGLLCDLCIGVNCLGCISLDCFNCRGPLCEICIGANCMGCKGPKCTTCRGKDCSACKKPKCRACVGRSCTPGGSTTCDSLQCPIGGGDDPSEKEDEEQENPDHNVCIPVSLPDDPNPDTGSPGGGNGGNNRPPPVQSPDTAQNKNICYDGGQAASRNNMVTAAEQFCMQYDGFTFNSNDFLATEVSFGWDEQHSAGLNVLVRLEAKSNCKWTLNKSDCNKQLLQIIDGCDQDTTADKQGGVLENNCLAWRIDPEQNKDIAPPPPPPKPSPTEQPTQKPDPPSQPIPSKKPSPEVKQGNHPRYDIFTTDLGSSFDSFIRFGRMGVASYDKYRVCLVSGGWRERGVPTMDMPKEIKGITGVFGDTCDYKETSNIKKAKEGDTVGKLTCAKWDDAVCKKDSSDYACGSSVLLSAVRCFWDLKEGS